MSHTDSPGRYEGSRALRKAPSLILNASPARTHITTPKKHPQALTVSKARAMRDNTEVVPDSEDERTRDVLRPVSDDEVIEISSDEDDAQAPTPLVSEDPFLEHVPGAWPEALSSGKENSSADRLSQTRLLGTPPTTRAPRSRQAARSNASSTFSDLEVIELSDSSPERTPPVRPTVRPPASSGRKHVIADSELRGLGPIVPLYDDDEDEDDGFVPGNAILTWNGTGSRRPVQLKTYPSQNSDNTPVSTPPDEYGSRDPAPASLAPRSTPGRRRKDTGGPFTPQAENSSVQKQPRTSKKAAADAKLALLASYAQRWYDDLNLEVFDSKLPKDTELIWNKKLLTTAGRAHYKRDRHGVETSSIHLACKILDCEERIRCTLSHEMCHLACWSISQKADEQHGSIFKAWGAKLMDAHPEVEVSTRHNYEISYPYQWECTQCKKIYGRFSKSIKVEEHGCSDCSGARLIALFATRQGTPRTPKSSRLASGKARDSPQSLSVRRLGAVEAHPLSSPSIQGMEVRSIHDSDSTIESAVTSDSEIEILAFKLGATSIAA